jgi:RNA polymerase primary sigma factor
MRLEADDETKGADFNSEPQKNQELEPPHYRTNTMIDVLLRDIGQTELLTGDEEIRLAEQISQRDFVARDHLVRANLRLVVHLARDFKGRGVSIEDLISEGSIGLMRAAEGWTPTPGIRFASYASDWIKQSLRRAVDRESRTIRLPRSTVASLTRWRRTKAEMSERLGRVPEDDEVAAEMRLPARKLKIVLQALRIGNGGTGIDDERALACELADWRTRSADEVVEDREDLEWMTRRLARLDGRYLEVVTMRYGLDGNPPMNLQEISAKIGRHRDTVRSIEAAALVKLACG